MTPTERRASVWLASIFALRMFGLFSLLPIFAIYAKDLRGGDSIYLVALTLAIYGVGEALMQIAFGAASDRFGRKPVIATGLILFIMGSVIAALSDSIYGVLVGRVIQGLAAISSAVTALTADSTRDEVRTKAMAMIGVSIGMSFICALVFSPIVASYVGLSGIFWMNAVLGLAALGVLYFVIPDAPMRDEPATMVRHGDVLFDPNLWRLNLGAFVLHACQTAMFVIVPTMLVSGGELPSPEHWKIYLPVVVGSFVLMLFPMVVAERRGKMREVFLFGIAILVAALLFGAVTSVGSLTLLAVLLFLFFFAFNLLESMQPSLVSRLAPPAVKGFALGVFGTTRATGFFMGGVIGGAVAKHFGNNAVFYVCAALAAVWFVAAYSMIPPLVKKKES
jgi:MFS family permease